MMPWHVAESREEAIADIRDGLLHWHNEYNVGVLGRPGATRHDN